MEDKFLDIEMKIKVTSEDIDDIMLGALDGGITHWCDRVIPDGDYLGDYASDQIIRGGKLILYGCEGKEYYLDLEKLLNGIKLWAKNSISYNYLEQVNGELVIKCCSVDVKVCDAIVQYALFGNVIYDKGK